MSLCRGLLSFWTPAFPRTASEICQVPLAPVVLNRFLTFHQTGHFSPRSRVLKVYFRMWRLSSLAFLSRIFLIIAYISSHAFLGFRTVRQFPSIFRHPDAISSERCWLGEPRASFCSSVSSGPTLPLADA